MKPGLESPGSAGGRAEGLEEFRNSQEYIEREAPRLVEERRRAGLDGLVGDLACVILSVEPDRQRAAAEELQRYTGFTLTGVYDGPNYVTAVLQLTDEAAVARLADNPCVPQPVGNPPQAIYKYDYKGQAVYYVPPQCCDQYSQLYDANGSIICAPDGGLTGQGNKKCSDFFNESTNRTLIWRDSRTR